MGVTGNILDYSYEANSNTFDVFNQFAGYCAAAAEIDPKYCPLASASMKSIDPTDDIFNRIKNIFNTLATVSSIYSSKSNTTYDYDYLIKETAVIKIPSRWNSFADTLLDLERAIQSQRKRDTTSSADFNTFRGDTYLTAFAGTLTSLALPCIDNNYTTINNDTSFTNYLSKQIARNNVIGYQGIEYGVCLGWPDLSSYNVEKFTGPFPASLRNKILIVAEVYIIGNAYNSILNTYEFVGEDNAVLLIHDAFGTIFADRNNCTLNAIREYFNGIESHL